MSTAERSTTAKQTDARFGRAMLEHWALDPRCTYLNHGTVGATPRRVLEAQRRIRDEIEAQPSRFLLRELSPVGAGASRRPKPRMREAAAVVAEFVGAREDDLVFVDNATTGVNAVLRSYPFEPGDEILMFDLTYGAVIHAARYVASCTGVVLRTVDLPHEDVTPERVVEAFVAGITKRTRVAIIDHIVSEAALLLPVKAIVERCHAEGVRVLVDGAHAPGAIALDIPALGADWYVGNLHKWAWVPRSSGILWAPPERQKDLHPTVISWGYEQGMAAEFDLVGTRDPSPHLAAPAAIDLMHEFGTDAVQGYNHALAWRAANWLAERWGTPLPCSEAMIGTMATAMLPERFGATREDAQRLRDALLFDQGVEVQMHAYRGRVRARISAQVYNDMSDVERLAEAVDAC